VKDLKLYLDNCCYNRPFDDQNQLKIHLETQAKLFVQQQIKDGICDLVWSYILEYENEKNPYEEKRNAIIPWKKIAKEYITETEDIIQYAEKQGRKGIKPFDALHISCAVASDCDYFLTTDRKLLNTPQEDIRVMNPIDFIREMGE
jgi:predicted nucleic acid-binding protein